MNTFSVTQKILSIGPSYQVKSNSSNDVIMTVRGKAVSLTPQLEIKTGENGSTIAKMKGNMMKTKFEIEDTNGKNIGSISFPVMPFMKGFTLNVNGLSYKSKGGVFSNKFTCQDENNNEILTISKDLAFKDKFTVLINNNINKEVGILAAVALDQKYFESND